MLKLALINAVGTVALATVLGAGAPAQATQPFNLSDALHVVQNLGPEFTSVYLSMSSTERDLMLFSLADRWSMQALDAGAGTAEVTATERPYDDFAQMYVQLSSTDRDQLLFKLADERSMTELGEASFVASR